MPSGRKGGPGFRREMKRACFVPKLLKAIYDPWT
jgi:hypothetical protein